MRHNGLKLNVVGISNSKKAFYAGKDQPRQLSGGAEGEREESNPEHLCEEIVKMNIFNSVFVDCTASPDVAALYETLMNNNVSVVAANKEAASSSYDNYTKLKETARHRDIKFLFETNVGAGSRSSIR